MACNEFQGPGGQWEAARRLQKGKSLLVRKTIYIGHRKSAVYVESPFWESLREIAATDGVTLTELLTRIAQDRRTPNLSSAIRLFILHHYVTLAKQKKPDDQPTK